MSRGKIKGYDGGGSVERIARMTGESVPYIGNMINIPAQAGKLVPYVGDVDVAGKVGQMAPIGKLGERRQEQSQGLE